MCAQHGRDQGFLVNPGTGPVTAAALFTPPGRAAPTHLLSGGADGALAIWRSGGGWEALKLMRGHRGAVNGLALHPSGRLALSVGHDVALRMWNMARGRCSYTARLDAEADAVAFARAGQARCAVCCVMWFMCCSGCCSLMLQPSCLSCRCCASKPLSPVSRCPCHHRPTCCCVAAQSRCMMRPLQAPHSHGSRTSGAQ
jgi:WD40 repeat protein